MYCKRCEDEISYKDMDGLCSQCSKDVCKEVIEHIRRCEDCRRKIIEDGEEIIWKK
jgi:hypothetical protein